MFPHRKGAEDEQQWPPLSCHFNQLVQLQGYPSGQTMQRVQMLRIETFFSDQKSRSFHLHKSHISDPVRLARLLIAACLAYVWMIYRGTQAHLRKRIRLLHRTDRCDLSSFQLGLDLLHHFLEEDLDILIDFRLPEALFQI